MNTLNVRLAASEEDLKAAQKLRYRMFYEEAGVPAPLLQASEKRDFDRFDAYCDHLLVTRRQAADVPEQVIGTYRLLRKKKAREAGGHIAGGEFDLAPLRRYPGDAVELGRACVDPEYRSGAVMQLLWKGIADYILARRISLLFGCASFPGTNIDDVRHSLSYLYHHHMAEAVWAPRAHADNATPFRPLPLKKLDGVRALREMPPLIKGYLRTGAVIGEGVYIDHDLNTIDVCMLMETGRLASRYARHYAVQEGAAAQTGLLTR